MRGGNEARGFFREGGVEETGRGSLRRRFEAIARRAAEAGYSDAAALFRMTPEEIELNLAAFAARERRAMERIDAAAWLTGRYCATGWHAPGRYPRRPDGIRPAPMSDGAMKEVFAGLAARRTDEEGLNEHA